jgi:arylsulfatase A-like enzyme
MRRSDIFVVAAWAATFFGLLEGVVLIICRAYPANVAPYKVSNDALWIAPSFDIVLFSVLAAGLLLLAMLGRKWLKGSHLPLAVYGFFVFIGILAPISIPKIVHPVSAALLSLGLTAAICRKLAGFEPRVTAFLRARLLLIPTVIIIAGLGVVGYERFRESSLLRQLPPAASGSVNVLLIMLDTVRYDKLIRPAGNSLTPRLDQIVAKSVRYDNAWSTTSWSLPSQASVLTGRYPHEHGADWPSLEMDEKYPTLGEFLGGRGYVSGAFSGNASWVTPEYLGRGFLRFDVYTLEDILRRTAYGRPIGRLLWEVGYHYAGRGKKAPEVNAEFLEFLDDYPDRPFFAYLCYMDVNQAFHHRKLNRGFWTTAPSQHEVIAAYDEGLRILDRQIGDLFSELARRRILNNSLVIITSDHGESFGAESTHDHDPAGHGTSLYPEQTKVPLFVVYPDKIPDARKVELTVSLRDIPKTIAQILNLGNSPFGGQALPVAAESINALEHYEAHVLATLNYDNQEIQSVIMHPWQYIKNAKDPGDGEELYDLAEDPMAKKNLKANDSLSQFRALLKKLLNTEL